MAMSTNSHIEENQLGIKVRGDIGDFQIIEEETESDDGEDSTRSSEPVNSLSELPQSIVKQSILPVFGSVRVTKSDNVHFGNNTYFNGPVTIKQVVQTKEQDNAGYEPTENDVPSGCADQKSDNNNEDNQSKPTQLQLWLKLTFTGMCVVIVGSICAIVSVTVIYNTQDDTATTAHDNEDSTTDPLLIAPTHLRIVSRIDWLAQPVEKPLDKIRLPVPWVVIQHTATESCHAQSECVLSVRLIQMFHIESRGWYDIGYNFLVAGDGSAYFGRGWEYEGAHTLGYNKYSMGIAFIGTFNNEPPPKKQLDACKKLIQRGVELGKIAKDYKLFAHRQLASTLSPGDKLFDILKEWPNFVKNATDIEKLVPKY